MRHRDLTSDPAFRRLRARAGWQLVVRREALAVVRSQLPADDPLRSEIALAMRRLDVARRRVRSRDPRVVSRILLGQLHGLAALELRIDIALDQGAAAHDRDRGGTILELIVALAALG